MKRRNALQAAVLALSATAFGSSLAQAYPSRTITLLVPYAAGGNADLTARLLADALSRSIGQQVVVDNKGGAGGSIGATHVVGSRPDGYTLLFSVPSVFSITPQLIKTSYTIASIKPVALVTKTPLVLVVKRGSKHKTLVDLVAAARANPGAVPMGHSGLGTPNHLAQLNLEAVAKVEFNVVPYKGSGPMLQDLLAGQVDAGADQITTSRPFIDSGDLVPLAVFGPPLASLPGIPSVSSLGPEPFDATTFLGIAAPLGTPDEVVAALQKAIATALEDQKFVGTLTKLGSAVQWGDGKDYEKLVRTEGEFVRRMIASGRIRPE